MVIERQGQAAAPISQDADGLSLLYMRSGVAPAAMQTHLHDHPYWQLEIMTAPGGSLQLTAGRHVLRRGDIVVLPPGCDHQFRYRAGCAWLSVRYAVEHPGLAQARIIHDRDDPMISSARRLVCDLAAADGGDASLRLSLHHALLTVLQLVHRERPVAVPSDPLVTRVEQRIAQAAGCRLAIADLAQALGYSRNHLTSTYKARSGRSLKERLDQASAEAAARMLAFDDRSVGQIAEALGFGDIYAFSRFFLRVTGQRPSAYREALRSGDG